MLLKNNIPFKYIFGKVKFEFITVLLYTVTVSVIYDRFHFTRISIPLSVPGILGTVISLLLAFRSNQAYDRWWEARIIWGSIVNDSRSLSRQILCFMDGDGERDNQEVKFFRERFIKRQIAWSYSLGQSLRGLNATKNLDRYISKKEIEFVSRYSNVPMALLDLHARDLKIALNEGWINRFQQVEIDETLSKLCDAMGKCERIKNTIFPATYSHYIRFTLIFFILMLPFGLLDTLGLMEIPLVTAIATSFLLIEKMAIHLQDPFENKPTDTPVTAIARTIEKNLKQMIDDQDIYEEKEVSEHFYIL